jgi:3-hydroxyacyl-CoA dehydrogenase
MSTQMVGADTSEFFPALKESKRGFEIANGWSTTARRLNDEFKISVGFVNGKRCLGGFLELLMHCHYLVAEEGASLGMPEVTLPVVPGMEGCHWPFRKAGSDHWPKLIRMLLGGQPVGARDSVGWLVDYAGPMDEAVKVVWKIANGGDSGVTGRKLETGKLKSVPQEISGLPEAGEPGAEAARKAIMDNIQHACGVPLGEAIGIQAQRSADFMTTKECNKGRVGAEYMKTAVV